MQWRRTVVLPFAVLIFAGIASPALAKSRSPELQESINAQQAEIETLKEELASLKEKAQEKRNAGYDNGFFIGTRDGDYMLKFRFFSAILYEYDHNEDADDVNTFGIRRARFLFSGNAFNPNFTFMIMPEMVTQYVSTTTNTAYSVVDTGGNTSNFTVTGTDTNDRNFRLLYLWAQYRFADEFQIRVGEFIPPTEFFFLASNLLEFIDFPSIANTEPFTPNFQLGVDFLGTIAKKISYEAFAVNASSFDRININKSFRVGTCLTFNIFGKPGLGVADVSYSESPQLALTLAGAYERQDIAQAAPVSINTGDGIWRGQTNVVFRYRGFSFVPEFIVIYNNSQHYKHYAMALQTGYFILPKKLEIDAQANYLKYSGDRNDRYELSGGFNYYFFGHPVKLQADYSVLINQRASDKQVNQRVRVGTQVGFF